MKNVLKRAVVGIILAGILFLFLWLSSFSQIIFDMLVYIMGAIGVIEMYVCFKKKYKPIFIPLLTIVILSYPLIYFFRYFGIFMLLGIGFVLSAIFFVFVKKKKSDCPTEITKDNIAEFSKYNSADLSATFFIMMYPMLILSFVFVMNLEFGIIPLMIAMGAALGSDLFAYFVGSIIKGPKIFPTISPKKTYSGCIGGIFGGAIGALLIYAIFEVAMFPANTAFTFTSVFKSEWLTILFYGLMGALLAILSEIGDLFASRFKRELKIKDFSKLLGEHGGVMDRIDSTLLVIVPIFLVMVVFFA